MKKNIRIFALIFATMLLLSFAAFAVGTEEHSADALYELGLFRGTDKGYELEREATRAEAAVMLVRFLGAEDEALALTWNIPFEDVDNWAKPYVQYLMEKGLTNGTSLTTFGSREKCTLQQYVTFLLRALGYSDKSGGDFTYARAIDFADEVGLLDTERFFSVNVYRGDMCDLSYTALSLSPKSGERDLLTKLVSAGAIKDAKGYDKLFENYRVYGESMKPLTEGRTYSCTGKAVYEEEMNSQKNTSTITISVAMDVNHIEQEKSRLIFERETNINGEKTTEKYYYKDGTMYVSDGEKKLRGREDFGTLLQFIGVTAFNKLESITEIKDIKIEDKPENTREIYVTWTNLQTVTVTVKNGAIVSCEFVRASEMPVDGYVITAKETSKIENIRFGTDVAFPFPKNLDTYKDPSDVSSGDNEAIEKAVAENKDVIREQAAETFYDIFINLIAVGITEDFTEADIAALEKKVNDAVDAVLADFEVRFLKVSSAMSDSAVAEITVKLKDANVFFTKEVIEPMVDRAHKSGDPAVKSYLTMFDELIAEIEKAPAVPVEATFVLERKNGVWKPAE